MMLNLKCELVLATCSKHPTCQVICDASSYSRLSGSRSRSRDRMISRVTKPPPNWSGSKIGEDGGAQRKSVRSWKWRSVPQQKRAFDPMDRPDLFLTRHLPHCFNPFWAVGPIVNSHQMLAGLILFWTWAS